MRTPFFTLLLLAASLHAAERPNILWLTCEDSSPHVGCYGDKNANTPTIDALAAKGMRYERAWSNAPVCAPARTCIISGRWAPADGAEHMRSEVPMPAGHKMFPQFLREAGYYCTNNSKEDYNLTKPDGVWDESSGKAHWKNRPEGKPFFAVFNDTITHESQIRAKPHTLVHDPDKLDIPPYHPDTPEVRHDWAQHYDNMTTMDGRAAQKLKELDEAGLAEDTIVVFFADHGTGMPRSKRWPYDSGLRVPFVVYFPKKWQHLAPKDYQPGSASKQLIQFIDLAPTMLSIAGIKAPDYFHGSAFAGQFPGEDDGLVFGFRGRMDERGDFTRSISDGRFIYIRNFQPALPYGQHIAYMFDQATTRVWYDMYVNGQCNRFQKPFWREKPMEELYDLQEDPYEVENLGAQAGKKAEIVRLSYALGQWMVKTRDLGVVPEATRLATSAGKSPKDVFADNALLNYPEVLLAALHSSDRSYPDASAMLPQLKSPDALIRYWGLQGCLMRLDTLTPEVFDTARPLLKDSSPGVHVSAAEVLARKGTPEDQQAAWQVLIHSAVPINGSCPEANDALNSIDRMGDAAKAHKDELAKLSLTPPEGTPSRLSEYPRRMLDYLADTLGYTVLNKPEGKGKGKKGKAKAEQ